MLVEIAIGDAYGAAFEFVKKSFVKANNDLQYHEHPKRKDFGKGNYTDDTQMSLGTARFMLSDEPVTQLGIAKAYYDAFKENPIDGYARGFQSVLQKVRGGNSLIRTVRPYSVRNGSVMRAVPVGLYADIQKIIHFSIVQSSITHATLKGVNAAIATSLAAHLLYYNKAPKKDLFMIIKDYCDFPEVAFKGPIACDGIQTAFTAIRLIQIHSNMKDILAHAIRLRGDTDSVASVALGLASLTKKIKNNLPLHLYDKLENGEFGKDYLLEIDSKLFEKYLRPHKVKQLDVVEQVNNAK